MYKIYIVKKKFLIDKINKVLSIILLFLAIYILACPFIPQAALAISKTTDSTRGYRYISTLATQANSVVTIKDLQPIPLNNTLVIPQISVDGQIYEGDNISTLNKGFWRRPNSSTPDKGGNTVIAAHRFLYLNGPNTFYSLDQLKIGDRFMIFWKGNEYDYQVFNILVVPPTDISIENNTKNSILTLYTCTPLWTSTDRLVIQANFVKLY